MSDVRGDLSRLQEFTWPEPRKSWLTRLLFLKCAGTASDVCSYSLGLLKIPAGVREVGASLLVLALVYEMIVKGGIFVAHTLQLRWQQATSAGANPPRSRTASKEGEIPADAEGPQKGVRWVVLLDMRVGNACTVMQ